MDHIDLIGKSVLFSLHWIHIVLIPQSWVPLSWLNRDFAWFFPYLFTAISVIPQLKNLLYLLNEKQKLEVRDSWTPRYVKLLPLGGRLWEVPFIHHVMSPLQTCAFHILQHLCITTWGSKRIVHIVVFKLITSRAEIAQKSISPQSPWNYFFLCYRLPYIL